MVFVALTDREAEIVDTYIFRKACRLEEYKLTDSECYPNLMSAHLKIKRQLDKNKK